MRAIKAATAHLTFESTRDQYLAGVPPDVAARIQAESWEEGWRVMNLPGRMEAHVFDAGHLLLETHAATAVSHMLNFIRRTQIIGRKI